MNLPLIPAPATATSSDGTLLVSGAVGVVVQAAELAAIAARFVADVHVDAGIALTLGSPGITLLIDRDGIDDIPPASGLRADGQTAADERHGLEITAEGVRVWGPTAEAVHRGLTSLRQLITAHARDVKIGRASCRERV